MRLLIFYSRTRCQFLNVEVFFSFLLCKRDFLWGAFDSVGFKYSLVDFGISVVYAKVSPKSKRTAFTRVSLLRARITHLSKYHLDRTTIRFKLYHKVKTVVGPGRFERPTTPRMQEQPTLYRCPIPPSKERDHHTRL